jgi:hypothetical protein
MQTGTKVDELKGKGYSVEPSRSQAGRWRWWRDTGSDGHSVPERELSEAAFDSECQAWEAALVDARTLGLVS